jgi:serine/threonine-protein kinase
MKIDTGRRQVVQTVPVGRNPDAMAVGGGAVWVANEGDGTVTRIDQSTGNVMDRAIQVGGSPKAIAFAEGSVWVADSHGAVRQIDANSDAPGGRIKVDQFPAAVGIDKGIVWVAASSQRAAHYRGAPGTVRRLEQSTGKVQS